MKRFFLLFFISQIIYLSYSSEIYIESFTAQSNGKDIVIEFKTINEKKILSFEIERSINNGSFKKITTLEAKGYPSHYKYIDTDAYLRNNQENQTSSNQYSYRLKINFKDNTSIYTNSINLTHKINRIYKTWGMIKEMFK
ncbi:MAG: hypothetical protein N2517_02510 [Ignavibacteria bacterium]|nr:hypothetical protein [Ignavibacteria bacterium]